MKGQGMGRSLLSMLALTCVFALFAGDGGISAQEKKVEAKKADAKKDRDPYRRLPAYFAQVVDDEQREKIYSLNEKFGKQIEQLEQQLAALRAERDQAIDALLTADQLKEIEAKREEAAKKRSPKSPKE